MKANPGYKWCPTTNKPVKSSSQTVGNARKKAWSFPTNPTKDPPAAKKVPKTDTKPQLNFAMAGLYLSSLLKDVVFLHFSSVSYLVFMSYCFRHGSTDPTKMGGLSMLLLAGEHALTAREVGFVFMIFELE